jgi:hypothetical protein
MPSHVQPWPAMHTYMRSQAQPADPIQQAARNQRDKPLRTYVGILHGLQYLRDYLLDDRQECNEVITEGGRLKAPRHRMLGSGLGRGNVLLDLCGVLVRESRTNDLEGSLGPFPGWTLRWRDGPIVTIIHP